MFTDNVRFMAAVMDTPMGAVCVKKRGPGVMDDDYGHGILVSPTITCGMVRGPEELARILRDDFKEPFVTVRGHGWAGKKRFRVVRYNRTV
jgi:hypothetical protein